MKQQKNDHCEGRKDDSEGKYPYSVITPCSQLKSLLSLNCQGLQWNFITVRLFYGRDTQRERGLSKKINHKWRLLITRIGA
jgi:hypothetical protein